MLADVLLRPVTEEDLPRFFKMQQDFLANQMAAFSAKNPADRQAFMAHWHKILADETTIARAILFGGELAGNIACFERENQKEVCYWIEREYWGRGIASMALALFLSDFKLRPLLARAAKDNHASVRVLQKSGFQIVGHARGFANARGKEIEEVILSKEA